MRILVVGTHPQVRQPSMSLFAEWLLQACGPLGEVELIAAPAACLNAVRRRRAAAKWLAYFDQYLFLTLMLWAKSREFDLVLVADQGNAPSARLVPRRKLVVMVHDTIAMRQALGLVTSAPSIGQSGAVLQLLIRRSVQRACLLLSNPGIIPLEIERLRLGERVAVVGCPADLRRLAHPTPTPLIEGPYMLSVASDGWRKRKRDMIPLWQAVQTRTDLKLVLAGHTDEETRQAFEAAGITPVVLNDVSDPTLASLYENCAGLISSSLEEGLCIPVLEALYFHKHVFLPDVSPSYADFFGNAVTRVDFNAPEIAANVLLNALQRAVDHEAIARIQAWAAPQAFHLRVQGALKDIVKQAKPRATF